MPVRYWATLVDSPALKTSWKNKKSTNKNPRISTVLINFLIAVFYQILTLISPFTRTFFCDLQRRSDKIHTTKIIKEQG